MKTYSRFTYYIIFSIIIIILTSTWYAYEKSSIMKNRIDLIRIAVLMSDVTLPIDPIKNSTISNAFFVNHLYANLISVNEKNEFEADLAKNFYWQDKTLTIEFHENSSVNAIDAEFSIKRSFVNDANDHGDLWKILCEKNESQIDCLKRISVSKNTLKIEVANKNNLQMIIPILASINYKIIPKLAFDIEDLSTAKIINYTLTSGKFFIKNDNLYELFPNERNFNETDTLISKLQIVDADSVTVQDLISKNLIDVVSTTITLFERHLKPLTEHGWILDKTHDIKITLLLFSKAAISKTQASERMLVGSLIKDEMKNSRALFSTFSPQFFQNFGQGYLSNDQIQQIKQSPAADLLSNKLVFSTTKLERWGNALKNIPNLDVAMLNTKSLALADSERPDSFIIANDVSFETSYSQISYLYKSGIFKSPDKTADQIINEYLSYENNEDKIKYINKLHFEVISNCYIFPIWSSPYITAVSSKFTSHMSKYNSRTLAWKIKKN